MKKLYLRELAIEYANEYSHNWWKSEMEKYNNLSDEDKIKYGKQHIGFNDIADLIYNAAMNAYIDGYNKSMEK